MPSRDDSFWYGGSERADFTAGPRRDFSPLVRRWTWLDQTRQRFAIAIEVLDLNLECVLEAPSIGHVGSTLRAALRDRREAAVRDAAAQAMEAGAARSVSAYGLRARAVPLLTGGDGSVAAGLLVVADRLPEQIASSPAAAASIDHRLDAACHWLAPAIEATLETTKNDLEQAQAAERIAGIVEVVGALHEMGDEDDIVQMLMEAAGFWDGTDVRVYRQDAAGSFVLEACVPGADLRRIPSRLAGSLVSGRDQVFRLGSREEAEALGWDRAPDDTLFVPIGAHDSTDWLIAVSGETAPALAVTLGFLRQVLGLMLENVEARTRARLRRGLTNALRLHDAPFESAARIGLEILGLEASASSIQLQVTDELSRVPALQVEWSSAEPEDTVPGGTDGSLQDTRVHDWSSGVSVVLTLRRRGRALTAAASRLAQVAVELYGLWISGIILTEANVRNQSAGDGASALVGRLKSQVDAAGCLRIGGAVAVLFPEPSSPTGPQLDEAMQILQDHVRSSDIIGVVESSGAGVLLPHASASVASALVGRLEGAARERGLAMARIGATTFTPFSEVPEALVMRASAHARGGEMSGPSSQP